MIEALIDWGNSHSEIRALLLTGSRAIDGRSDAFSDYDLAVFLKDDTEFLSSNDWLEELGSPWVCVHETIEWKGTVLPTRLVIFDPGEKVDFAFYPTWVLEDFAQKPLPDAFAAGYHILVDKDTHAAKMDEPSNDCYQESPPTEKEFLRIIEEFWFELWHVAKYLARADLWSADFRMTGIKQEFLLPMIRWHTQAKHDWEYATHSQGKRMQEWVDSEIWNAVSRCLPGFGGAGYPKAVTCTMELFRRLAKESAERLGYSYPQQIDDRISLFIASCLI
jgi:aminoglycoside 6-adenylyltransferase